MLAQTTQKAPKPNRIYGIDVFKGWGVWYMFIIHAFIQQIAHYNGALFLSTISQVGSWWPYIFALPIGIISLWGFMFGFAFACTVAMQTMRLIDTNPKRIPKYIFHKLLTGILIILLNKIGYSLYKIPYFVDNRTFFPTLSVDYAANILDAIAWFGVLVPIIVWLLYGLFRIKRTNHLIITLLVFLTLWFALTPTLINMGNIAIEYLNDRNLYVVSLFISKFTVGRFRLLPGLGYGLIGSVYATMLYKKVDFKFIIRFALIFFAYCAVAAILWLLFIDPNALQNFTDETVPIPFTIISMSTMQFLLVLFIRTQDYAKSELKRVRAAKRMTFWRRYSVFSLTAFSIGTPIADRIYQLFAFFWGESVVSDAFNWNLWQIIAFIFFIWGFWEVILRLWETFEYKFSLDWFLAQIMAMLTGAKMGRSAVKPIIYGPNAYRVQEPIVIKQKITAIN